MGTKKRALSVSAAAIVNGVISRNTGVLLTVAESIFDTDTETTSEVITTPVIISLDQLSYSHSYNEDDQDSGILIVKNGDINVLSLDGDAIDPSDENEAWNWDKRKAIHDALIAIQSA